MGIPWYHFRQYMAQHCCWEDQKIKTIWVNLTRLKTNWAKQKHNNTLTTWNIWNSMKHGTFSISAGFLPRVPPKPPSITSPPWAQGTFQTCNQILMANQRPPRFGARTKPVKTHRDQTRRWATILSHHWLVEDGILHCSWKSHRNGQWFIPWINQTTRGPYFHSRLCQRIKIHWQNWRMFLFLSRCFCS